MNNRLFLEPKGLPWMAGENVASESDIHSVLERAGLNFLVATCKISAMIPSSYTAQNGEEIDFVSPTPVPNRYAVYRKDNMQPLGIVRDRYQIVQNHQVFSFLDDLISEGFQYERAGVLGGGRQVFVVLRAPFNMEVTDGDKIANYLIFVTSHDGSLSVRTMYTPVRLVCLNSLYYASRSALYSNSFRHTSSITQKLSKRDVILSFLDNESYRQGEKFASMAESKVDDEMMYQILSRVIFSSDEIERMKLCDITIPSLLYGGKTNKERCQISTRKINMLTDMVDYYRSGIGQKDIINTKWGVYNAITGYFSNIYNNNGEKRMHSLLFGDSVKKISMAYNMLSA